MTAATFRIIATLPSSKTRKVAANISKFSWPYFRFGALQNEIKTQRRDGKAPDNNLWAPVHVTLRNHKHVHQVITILVVCVTTIF